MAQAWGMNISRGPAPQGRKNAVQNRSILTSVVAPREAGSSLRRVNISLEMEDQKPKSDAEGSDQSGEGAVALSWRALKPIISADPVLGIPVLSFGEDAPVLTSGQVKEMLSDFP